MVGRLKIADEIKCLILPKRRAGFIPSTILFKVKTLNHGISQQIATDARDLSATLYYRVAGGVKLRKNSWMRKHAFNNDLLIG